jgi:hypothetical protein
MTIKGLVCPSPRPRERALEPEAGQHTCAHEHVDREVPGVQSGPTAGHRGEPAVERVAGPRSAQRHRRRPQSPVSDEPHEEDRRQRSGARQSVRQTSEMRAPSRRRWDSSPEKPASQERWRDESFTGIRCREVVPSASCVASSSRLSKKIPARRVLSQSLVSGSPSPRDIGSPAGWMLDRTA